jgi:hypothetical protein
VKVESEKKELIKTDTFNFKEESENDNNSDFFNKNYFVPVPSISSNSSSSSTTQDDKSPDSALMEGRNLCMLFGDMVIDDHSEVEKFFMISFEISVIYIYIYLFNKIIGKVKVFLVIFI